VFGQQVLADELGIARADRVAGEALEHVGTAKDLGFQTLAVGPRLSRSLISSSMA